MVPVVALDRPVTVCLGSGGVGKTTLAAALGVAGAEAGHRVVVLTIDPAQRLASTLGLEPPLHDAHPDPHRPVHPGPMSGGKNPDRHGLGQGQVIGNEPVLVEGPWPGQLWAAMLDPMATLRATVTEHGTDQQAARLAANPLLMAIVGSMSGAGEYLAAERLRQLHHDPRFDRVVLDTPPSRHGLDFLDSPDRLTRFLDNRLYRSVLAPRSRLLRPVNAAAQLVFRLTARLVGTDLVDNVIALFRDLAGLDQGFRRGAVETSALLTGDDCGYTLITSPRDEPVREASWIHDGLQRRGHALGLMVVNRRFPVGRPPSTNGGEPPDDVPAALVENWRQLATLASQEDALVTELIGELPPGVPVVTIDEQAEPITNLEGLARLARLLG